MDIPTDKLPRHVGIILDGNRRFAKQKLSLQPWKGHEYGKKKVVDLLDWCKELGIKELTVYAFSLQNFSRPKEEVTILMKLFIDACKEFAKKDEDERKQLRIRVVGRKHLLPTDVQAAVNRIEEDTKKNGPFTLNVALAYGGREEIVDAVRELAVDVAAGKITPADIDVAAITDHLQVRTEPDLVIRTSGEHRTSNFLVWQSWYSEWVFVKKYWPEFTKEDFLACLEEYASRDRRFGGNGKH